MNFQLAHFIVKTQHDNQYDLEDKAANFNLKAACSPAVVFSKEEKRQLLAESSRC